MKYPYCLLNPDAGPRPVFRNLTGSPYVADMSYRNPVFRRMDVRDQKAFQDALDQAMAPRHHWGVAPYLERRDTLLSDCPQMVREGRFFHLGLDVIVPLGTPLHAPLAATVHETGYEAGEGNYGGFVLLRHDGDDFETFYSFYGHLNRDSFLPVGAALKAGDPFAAIGDFHENGNWFYHTHIQIITQKGLDAGYISKGYCSERDLADMPDICPDPLPLFKI